MTITLGLNISSSKAQTQLGRASDELRSVFERLSSGQRINRASDDAAGLAVAESLNADARVYTQGVRNLNDGISVLNIADGALQELTNITFRLTELAEQAANGTLGTAQRASLDEEAQALKAEYFRIAKSTEFNGRKLFEGDYGVLSLQAGYGTNATISNGLGGAIGAGTFRAGNEIAIDFSVNVASADFDGDGIVDLAAVSNVFGSAELYVYKGNGDGTFQSGVLEATGSNIDIEVADVNNDGSMDLVTANTSNGSIQVLIGNGDGTFQASESYAAMATAATLTTGDFNGDGIIDVATAGSIGSNMAVLIGNGDGSFSTSTSHTTSANTFDLVSGDVTGDGILDLVVGLSGGNLEIFSGDGSGGFQSEGTVSVSAIALNVELGDLNGDGALDIISGTGAGTNVAINNGDGTFQSGVAVSSGRQALSVTLGDFNGDGVPDIVETNGTASGVYIHIGRGDGTFQAEVSYDVDASGYAAGVITDDFDGDGVSDIVTTSYYASGLNVLMGNAVDGVAPLLDFSLETIADAKQALSRFQQKLDQLSSQRGQIGAFQSRIEVAENVLSISAENFKAAESRIRDADIAQESANLVRLQILQQASAAVLGQANQQPELVLQLLRGGA